MHYLEFLSASLNSSLLLMNRFTISIMGSGFSPGFIEGIEIDHDKREGPNDFKRFSTHREKN